MLFFHFCLEWVTLLDDSKLPDKEFQTVGADIQNACWPISVHLNRHLIKQHPSSTVRCFRSKSVFTTEFTEKTFLEIDNNTSRNVHFGTFCRYISYISLWKSRKISQLQVTRMVTIQTRTNNVYPCQATPSLSLVFCYAAGLWHDVLWLHPSPPVFSFSLHCHITIFCQHV